MPFEFKICHCPVCISYCSCSFSELASTELSSAMKPLDNWLTVSYFFR
ncbi:hypothetical protein HanPSC8_Chr06g0242321 [Helianthus annuus]|nr:hypothetical protein HanPSC8_Chr06g0242321 [Helianthus annuus]